MPNKKAQKTQTTILPEFKLPPQKKDLPATQGMLQLVRGEVKADIRELRSEMKAEFYTVRAEFSRVDARFEHVLSEVSRIGVLVEEQNSNNRVVLEELNSQIAKKVESTVASTLARVKT